MASAWRWIFYCEIPLMGITIFWWLFLPYSYLIKVLGIREPGISEQYLLALYAGTTLTLAAYYTFILVKIPLDDLVFLVYQVVLLAGDVFIVGATVIYMIIKKMWNWGLITQAVMALIWGGIRIGFLASVWP